MQKPAITCKSTQNRAKKYKNESKQIKTQKHTCTTARTNFGRSRYTTRPCLKGGNIQGRHPRGVQERPRAGPELPKGGEVASKSDPREVRSPPKPRPTSPKTRMEQDFCGKLCSTRSGSDIISFFHLRDKLAICKNLRKPKKNYGFHASGVTLD